ncbi:MAG TPA: TRAP transporter large permease [Beutenbergiaceae bacterium]|nr:TRAP transporter large permease [Beutenbergiaceae bacterium]
MTALIVTAVAAVLLLLRVPVGFALLLSSMGYIAFASPTSMTAAVERLISSLNGFTLLAIPLFILVGCITDQAGMADRIFDAANRLVGRVRGSLGYVNVTASLGFSWMSGAAVSDVAVMSTVMTPQMQKRGYSNKFIAGVTGASSLVTPMMPPSIPAIVFGVASGVSIGALFTATIVPAAILVVVLLLAVWFFTRKRDDLRRTGKPGSDEKAWKIYGRIIPVALAPVIILGGILGGFFTPTEAAAVAATYLLIISMVFYRSMNVSKLINALRTTFSTTASILFLVAASSLFGWVLTMERVPQLVGEAVMAISDNPTIYMLLSVAVLLLIGMVMEPTSAILITTPVLFPIALELGIDPVHYGVVLIFTLLIGMMTPPIGLVLFVMESVTTMKSKEIIAGIMPFVALFVGVAILLVFVPQLSLWLPGLLD